MLNLDSISFLRRNLSAVEGKENNVLAKKLFNDLQSPSYSFVVKIWHSPADFVTPCRIFSVWRLPGRTVIPDFGDRERQIVNAFKVSNEHNSDISFEAMPTVFSVTLQKV